MIFQRLLLLSINKDAVQRRKHPARPHAYDHSRHKPCGLYICSQWNRYSASTPNASTVFVVTVKSFRRRRAYGEVGAAGRSTPVLVSDRAWSCQWRRWIKAFLRSLPPNRRAAARGWPPPASLWNRMAGSCGHAPTVDGARIFISPFCYGSRNRRPRPPETFLRFVPFGSNGSE